MNILLIGLNHGNQLVGFDSEWKKFKCCLTNLCLRENPDLIAEELNIEAIQLWKADDSVARRVAENLNIDHIFCDPDSVQRKTLGIKSRKEIAQELGYGCTLTSQQSFEVDNIEKSFWETRERYMLERLLEHKFAKCIFLIGANHVDRFSALIMDNGIQCIIIEKNWQPEPYNASLIERKRDPAEDKGDNGSIFSTKGGCMTDFRHALAAVRAAIIKYR